MQIFLHSSLCLVQVFYFFKLLFNAFFFQQPIEFFSFFSLFTNSLVKPVLFYKCILLKRRFVYSFNDQPTFFLKGSVISAKVNLFFQDSIVDYAVEDSSTKQKTRAFSIKKTFLIFKRINLKKFILFYRFKFLKRRNLFSFFSNFRKKSFSEIDSFFSLNFLRVLHRIFPFFNFFLLRKLVNRGLILLNFKKIDSFFLQLQVGDFISIFFLSSLWALISKHIFVQNKHYSRIRRKLYMLSLVRSSAIEKTASLQYPHNFNKLSSFFRKVPSWVEVDYLTFSVFLVKKKYLSNFFFFFNPFLYRLFEFR